MSDLQISLLALGALIVAGVYLFNGWQERQYRRRSEQSFAREHDDVLLGDAANPHGASAERIEPQLQALAHGVAEGSMAKVPAPILIDPLIDYVVEFTAHSPCNGADLHEVLLALTSGWGKSVLVEGCESGSGEWQPAGIDCNGNFLRLRVALQLSNRAGCVDQGKLAAFLDTVLKWSGREQGEAKFLDVGEAHAMATQLDRFCADIDIAIGVNVVTADGNPFSGTKIRALAEAAGLKLEADGLFYARGDRGDAKFTLDNHEPNPFVAEQMKSLSTRGITFLLDVPRVEGATRVFDSMLELATKFASALGAVLVDDNRAELTTDAIEKIRRQLDGIVAKMEAGQIAVGGTRALRLFS